jgi:hypothetical protein
MKKKKAGKSKTAAGSMKSLPARALKPKASKGVKGGGSQVRGAAASETPKETVTFEYGGPKFTYTP